MFNQLPRIGLLYYTCNTHPPEIAEACRRQLLKVKGSRELGVVALKPVPGFGDWQIVLNRPRGRETLHYQILAGLERMEAEIVFLVEHDVLYHPSHFEFALPRPDVFFYNEHTYKVDAATGQAVFYYCKQTSGCCADRVLLHGHYQRRIARIEQEGRFNRNMGFEPGCHQFPRGVDNLMAESWMSAFPNVDIRHSRNATVTRWDPSQFRDKSTCQGWRLVDEVPGWGVTKGRFSAFLLDAAA